MARSHRKPFCVIEFDRSFLRQKDRRQIRAAARRAMVEVRKDFDFEGVIPCDYRSVSKTEWKTVQFLPDELELTRK